MNQAIVIEFVPCKHRSHPLLILALWCWWTPCY